MDGIAKSSLPATAMPSTCEDLQVLAPEEITKAITEAVAFGMNVKKETPDENASVRNPTADALVDHDYCKKPDDADHLVKRYGPYRKPPEQLKREQDLFYSTTRM